MGVALSSPANLLSFSAEEAFAENMQARFYTYNHHASMHHNHHHQCC